MRHPRVLYFIISDNITAFEHSNVHLAINEDYLMSQINLIEIWLELESVLLTLNIGN